MTTALASHWFFQGSFDAPSIAHPVVERVRAEAQVSAPIGDNHPSSVELNPSVIAFVRLLLLRCRPSHIARFIVTVGIDAVNLMFRRWPWADIRHEFYRVVNPRFMHLDPASAIFRVASDVRVIAAAFYRCPQIVAWRGAQSMRAMFRTGAFAMQAPTALRCIGTRQGHRADALSGAAVTEAPPMNRPSRCNGLHDKTPDAASCQIVGVEMHAARLSRNSA